jgi:hypothetical protein
MLIQTESSRTHDAIAIADAHAGLGRGQLEAADAVLEGRGLRYQKIGTIS